MAKFLLSYYNSRNNKEEQIIIDALDLDDACNKGHKHQLARYYDNLTTTELTYLEQTNGKYFIQMETKQNITYPSGIRVRDNSTILLFLANSISDVENWYRRNKLYTTEINDNGAKTEWLTIQETYIMSGSYDWLSNREHIVLN